MLKNTDNLSADEIVFFNVFNALSHKDNYILKKDLLNVFFRAGIEIKDPRLKEFNKELERLESLDSINFKTFKKIISSCITLLEKAINKSFIIPNFQEFKDDVKEIFNEVAKNTKGTNASYIPQLERVDPNLFSVAFCSIDGQMIMLGDYEKNFCVQSTSKPIIYCVASKLVGEENIHNSVGREPSGLGFNAMSLNNDNLPHNPMINAGAIVTCSMIKPKLSLADRFEYITNICSETIGEGRVSFDNSVYLSEKETANRNFALAYYMKEVGSFPDKDVNIKNVLDFYFQCCSIQTNTKQMARMMSTFANGGICPITNKRIFSSDTIKNCLSMMYSCGMYDFSGEYAFTVGLPAKSGVSGVLVIVIPNVGAFVIFSPPLDKHHNSVKGIDFSQRLVDKFSFHNYDSIISNKKKNPVATYHNKNLDIILNTIWAASSGNLSEIQKAISVGVNLNQGDYDNRTALHLATAEGHFKIVKFLLDKGADPNIQDRWGHSAINEAMKTKNTKIMKLFKEQQKTGE